MLCDLCAERGRWFGFAHDRAQWADWSLRPAMARAHGLTLAEGGNLRDGPWIPTPMEQTYMPCPLLGVDDEWWAEWMEEGGEEEDR